MSTMHEELMQSVTPAHPFRFTYIAEKTAELFHSERDDFYYRFIRGVPGSGKSVACIQEMFLWACDQEPYNGVRATRFACLRSTYPALKSTLIKTWKNWFSEDLWPVKQSIPFECKLEFGLPDGTIVRMEVIFIAIETDEDVKKLKSLELTGGFINEAFEVDRTVVTTLFERTGRYPPKNPSTGEPGPTRRGVWCDTNSPNEKHWWAEWERDPPDGFKFYPQPAPLIRVRNEDGDTVGWDDNPDAENIDNLHGGYEYYRAQLPGMTEDQLRVNIENKFGATFSGKAVFANEWKEDMEVRGKDLVPNAGHEIVVGIDTSGMNPAAVIGQTSLGRLAIFEELIAFNTDFNTFCNDVLIPALRHPRYRGCPVMCVVDPSNPRNFATGHTALQILQRHQFQAAVASTNATAIRVDAVKHFMKLRDGFLIHGGRCAMTVDGFKGGYHFKKIRGSGAGYQSEPAKDKHAHSQDAVQYMCLYLRRAFLVGGPGGADGSSVSDGAAERYRRRDRGRVSYNYA